MSLRQLHRCFFSPATLAAARLRLRALYENGYLAQPEVAQRHRVPEMVYWLDRRGVEVVAGLRGETLSASRLRKRRLPQWAKVEHDLTINDIRLTVNAAASRSPDFDLKRWVSEKSLASQSDRVTWRSMTGTERSKCFVPDGFFELSRRPLSQPKVVQLFAFLLEVDMATHTSGSFGEEKALAGLAYLESESYRQRFGVEAGRWLVVVRAGEQRLRHLIDETRRVGAGAAFFFTTFERFTTHNPFSALIWQEGDRSEPRALLDSLVASQ